MCPLPASSLERVAPRELERAARHELGHAIVAWLLGCEVRMIRVRRDGDDRAGECEHSRPTGLKAARTATALRHSGDFLIAIALAGLAAEVEHEGEEVADDWARLRLCGDDFLGAIAIAKDVLGDGEPDIPIRLERCLAEARRLLRLEPSRLATEMLAPELVAAGSIEGRRVVGVLSVGAR